VVPLMNSRAAAFTSAEVLMQYYDEEADKVLAPIKAFLAQQGWNVEFQDRRGSPGEQIAEVATGGEFDLVVMGSHGHSALAGVVMGSVATQVLAKCKTPVLLIR
jgi:nucleotide-binding universal stress UspA family protein